MQPRRVDLQPQVVFLVGHDGDALLGSDGHAPSSLAGGEFAADEMAFDEALSVDLGHVVEFEPGVPVGLQGRQDRLLQVRFEFVLLVGVEATEERPAGDVPGQADAR